MAAPVVVAAVRTAALGRAFRTFLASKRSIPASVVPSVGYHARPLNRNLGGEPYIPDKSSDKTPEWQRSHKFDRKLYGRHGDASGIEPATLWPSAAELEALMEEEAEWQPTLDVMLQNIDVREKEAAAKRTAKEKLVADNMAMMPKMVADWKRQRRETKQKQVEEKARRAALLAETRDRLGYEIDPRSARFREMFAEVEKEHRQKVKILKRQKKEQQQRVATTPTTTPATPPGDG